jgi:hypothetical protein
MPLRKKVTSLVFALLLLLLLPALLVMSSCNNENKDGVFVPVPKDTSALAKIDHFIPIDLIEKYQADFKRQRDSLQRKQPGFSIPFSEAFNKKAIIELLQIPNCVGIRVLYGIKQTGNSSDARLILVGVDSQGKNLFLERDKQAAAAFKEIADKAGNKKLALPAPPPPGGTQGGVEQGQCYPPCPGGN